MVQVACFSQMNHHSHLLIRMKNCYRHHRYSLSQMISKTPQPQFCSTPKQPKSQTPTVQGEIRKRRILSLATSRLSSRVTPLKSIQTPRVKSIKTPSLKTPPLKSSEAPRVKSIQTPRGAPLKLIKTPRITPPSSRLIRT